MNTITMTNSKKWALIKTLTLTLSIGGCSSLSRDHGFSDVAPLVENRINQTPTQLHSKVDYEQNKLLVQSLLEHTLTLDSAVKIALINNAGLQGALTELGIAQADLVQAGRLPNPSLSYLHVFHHEKSDRESRVLFDIMGLFTMPLRIEIEKRRFEQAKLNAAIEILQLAAKTKVAYYKAIAAEQSADTLKQIKEASEASALLAFKMAQVGNLSRQEQAREQAFYAESMAKFAQAEAFAKAEREQLIQLLGLWGDQIHFSLPKKLPELPPTIHDMPDIERQALLHRLDIQALKYQLEGTAKALGLSKKTRFIDMLDLGYARNSSKADGTKEHLSGYELSFKIPFFDWGGAKVAKAEAIYMQSVWNLHQRAVNARSESRIAYYHYRSFYDLAKHYRDEVVPLRKQIFDQSLLHYNGMLIGTFELLADAREQIAGVSTYIEALRDFWIADVMLQTATMVHSPNMQS